MKNKISLSYMLFVISVIGFSFFSTIIFFLSFDNPDLQSAYIKPLILNQISNGVPIILEEKTQEIRLEIPIIYIDAAVKLVGLTKDGIMDTPNNADDVGLFILGKRPGEKGTAVIAGHYGIWKDGKISVFNKLNILKKGDEIYIGDGKGGKISFVVREIKIYDLNSDSSEVFLSDDGKSHLNLITCVLDYNTKEYSKRLVVFTDKM